MISPRVAIIRTAQGPILHITRPGGPTESRPMEPREVARLMVEIAEAWLAIPRDRFAGVGRGIEDHSEGVLAMVEDDAPPHYVGTLWE